MGMGGGSTPLPTPQPQVPVPQDDDPKLVDTQRMAAKAAQGRDGYSSHLLSGGKSMETDGNSETAKLLR